MTDASLDGPASPLDAPHEGWTLLPPRSETGPANSFMSDDPTDLRVRIRYFIRDADSAHVGRAWFGPLAVGPPGHAHGGSIAALLDEVMGRGAWLVGHRVVAARIGIEFKKPVPLGTTVEWEASVVRVEGRRVTMRGALMLPGGMVCAQGEGLFIVMEGDRLFAGIGGG